MLNNTGIETVQHFCRNEDVNKIRNWYKSMICPLRKCAQSLTTAANGSSACQSIHFNESSHSQVKKTIEFPYCGWAVVCHNFWETIKPARILSATSRHSTGNFDHKPILMRVQCYLSFESVPELINSSLVGCGRFLWHEENALQRCSSSWWHFSRFVQFAQIYRWGEEKLFVRSTYSRLNLRCWLIGQVLHAPPTINA